jgi:serine/threonine protein kinase/tetratricopeptide (TPR) repeat protein
MPMSPDEVAELSHLLDEAIALEPRGRGPWLENLEQTRPRLAQQLREMLRRAATSDTGVLPELPKIDAGDAVARAGERVGPYVLLREIGRGGMGSVWLAERADGTFKRRVALKLPRLAWSADLSRRMARERDIGALLEHPNIARLYDAGVDEHGRPYIAMEYIDGQPIDVYYRELALDLLAKLKLFGEVTQAVAYAHGRLVLHRDLKPANVLVDSSGHVHLLDFGIAKLLDQAGAAATQLTQEQGRVLTLNYAAPEQITGRPLGVTADVYTLGVMLYELLTGALPYKVKRNTAGAIEEAILAGDAPPASSRVTDRRLARELRGDVDAILAKAIRRDPEQRYPTANALASDLQRFLDGQVIEARPDSAWYRLRKAVLRHRVPVIAVTAVLVVTVAGATTTFLQGRRAAAEAERTQLATEFVSELLRMNATQTSMATDARSATDPAAFVDRGAQLIEARFERQPEMKAEMYGVMGRVYADLKVDRLASHYATRQLEVLRSQKADAPRVARALMLLAEAALAAERDVDAEKYAQQTVEALPKNSDLLPEALALLSRAQYRTGKRTEARRSVDEGQSILAARGVTKSVANAWLTFEDGALLRGENRFDEATPLFEAAIDGAIAAAGPNSNTAIELQLRLARMLYQLRRADEGRQYSDAVVAALQELGDVGRIRAALVKAELQILLYTNEGANYTETMSVLDDVSQFLRSRASSLPAEVLAEVEVYRADASCYWGEMAFAKPLLETNGPLVLQSKRSLRAQAFILPALVGCAMGLGDHDAADRYARQLMETQVKMGAGSVPWAAWHWWAVAINLSMQGRHAEAEDLLLSAPAFDNAREDPSSMYADVIPLGLVQVRLDSGDFRRAQRKLPSNWPPPKERLGATANMQAYMQVLYGELMCASGQQRVGLEYLRLAEEFFIRFRSPNAPQLAQLRSVAGLCALSIGETQRAEEMAALARHAFDVQPAVSPYFKKPLAELEEKLGPTQPMRSRPRKRHQARKGERIGERSVFDEAGGHVRQHRGLLRAATITTDKPTEETP